jgi:DNA anti-recombination protein RmuC
LEHFKQDLASKFTNFAIQLQENVEKKLKDMEKSLIDEMETRFKEFSDQLREEVQDSTSRESVRLTKAIDSKIKLFNNLSGLIAKHKNKFSVLCSKYFKVVQTFRKWEGGHLH